MRLVSIEVIVNDASLGNKGIALFDNCATGDLEVNRVMSGELQHEIAQPYLEEDIVKLQAARKLFLSPSAATISEVIAEQRRNYKNIRVLIKGMQVARKRARHTSLGTDIIHQLSRLKIEVKGFMSMMGGAVRLPEHPPLYAVIEGMVFGLEDRYGIKAEREPRKSGNEYEDLRTDEKLVAHSLYFNLFEDRKVNLITRDTHLLGLMREASLFLGSNDIKPGIFRKAFRSQLRRYPTRLYKNIMGGNDYVMVYDASTMGDRLSAGEIPKRMSREFVSGFVEEVASATSREGLEAFCKVS